MDERLEQLANGLAGSADAATGEGPSLSPADIGGIFGDAVTDAPPTRHQYGWAR